jgi:glycosyltransferase involved in cell wall biosynthesis
MIVGEGLFRSKLEKLIATLNLQGRARLVGALPHNQLRLWYSAADLFCLVSHREGWPNVILESLACGTPVVATPAGGIPEILNSETLGLLTERDERKIADAIVAALGKKWISDQLVAHARNHSWNRAAADVLGVFQSALDSRKIPAAFATATQS